MTSRAAFLALSASNTQLTIQMRTLFMTCICAAFLGCHIPKNNASMIADATETDPLIIEIFRFGCVSFEHEVLKIYKEGKHYKYEQLHITSDTTINRGACKPGFERAFRKFESAAHDLKGGRSCTIWQSFDLRSIKRSFSFEDGACEFKEYYYLCEKLEK